jgi:hypothetical protein
VVPFKLWCFTRMRGQIPGGDPGGLRWIVTELMKAAPATLRARRPVSRDTLRIWRQLARRPEPYVPPGARG